MTSQPFDYFSCKTCGAEFMTNEQLGDHERETHARRERDGPSCAICGQTFRAYTLLWDHMQDMHLAEAPDRYPCPECGVVSESPERLEEHIDREHFESQGFGLWPRERFTRSVRRR